MSDPKEVDTQVPARLFPVALFNSLSKPFPAFNKKMIAISKLDSGEPNTAPDHIRFNKSPRTNEYLPPPLDNARAVFCWTSSTRDVLMSARPHFCDLVLDRCEDGQRLLRVAVRRHADRVRRAKHLWWDTSGHSGFRDERGSFRI